MSFWDSLKPAPKAPTASKVDVTPDQRTVSLDWDDGRRTAVTARTLRQYCPCAECVEEWSGKRTFEVETIPQDMKLLDVRAVGNYALAFTFADAHGTGLFTWTLLRELSEQHPAA